MTHINNADKKKKPVETIKILLRLKFDNLQNNTNQSRSGLFFNIVQVSSSIFPGSTKF